MPSQASYLLDTLNGLGVLSYTVYYLTVHHTQGIKRLQLNRQPQQACRVPGVGFGDTVSRGAPWM